MAFSSSRDRPDSTSKNRIKIKTTTGKLLNAVEQSSSSKTHLTGGQKTLPPTKQDYPARPQHARIWNDELLQPSSSEQPPAQRSLASSTRTHTRLRERPPSKNSKTE